MRLTCPTCRSDNEELAEVCLRCGIPLSGYARLATYPANLFNLGLSAAREGQLAHARDLFAAVVYWCPADQGARNALAMACYALGDAVEARHQWEKVLERFPTDALATQGIAALISAPREAKPRETSAAEQRSKPHTSKKYERSKKRR